MGWSQYGKEGLTPPCITTDGERAECVAVIALAPCDEVATLRLLLFHKILAGNF